MPSSDHKPIIVLAFANELVGQKRHLRELGSEQRGLSKILRKAEVDGLCEVVLLPDATAESIFETFEDQRYKHRIAIFHFSGHADGFRFLLESEDGGRKAARGSGLAKFLGQYSDLQLVFLNACATRGHVQNFLDANASVVLATSRRIKDKVARDFATRFYAGLATGSSIQTAYDAAVAAIGTKNGEDQRAIFWSEDASYEDVQPWELSPRPGATSALEWNLPDAADEPLFGLPDLPEQDLPKTPYRHLSWYEREHAELFFGRDKETRRIYNLITAENGAPILLLYGQSGVGKSSFLAAGLIPRLENRYDVRYCRRDGGSGLSGVLRVAVGLEGEGQAIREAWVRQEREKPLVVVLDQVEEAFTRASEAHPNEFTDLVVALQEIFADRATRPRGKLILSFREEWLAGIEAELNAGRLFFHPGVLLKRLGRRGIIDAVNGPAKRERLQTHYGLEIEEGLAEKIADRLLRDPVAPVAPMLQILLTRMWEWAKQDSKEKEARPKFTLAVFEPLAQGGLYLDDFLDRQIVAIKAEQSEAVTSGLLLDVLAHHTTSRGTAEQRTAQALVATYAHQQDRLRNLIQKCEDLHLLISRSGTTRLAHDTLAQPVRARFDESDMPGQRARRILENRAVEWSNGGEGTPLDETDLAFAEAGEAGMRALTPDERRLIKASRQKQHTQKRWKFAGVAVVIVALGLAGYQLLRRAADAEEALLIANAESIVADFDTKQELSESETRRLWELATGTEKLRIVVLAKLLSSGPNALSFTAHEPYFIHALLSIDPEARSSPIARVVGDVCAKQIDYDIIVACAALASQLRRLPDGLILAWGNAVPIASLDSWSQRYLPDLAERLDAEGARVLGEQLVLAMESETDSFRLVQLATSIVALARRLDFNQVRRAGERLVTAMEGIDDDSDVDELYFLADRFAALAGRLDSNQVRRAGERLVAAMEIEYFIPRDFPNGRSIEDSLTALAGQLDAEVAQALVERLVTAMEFDWVGYSQVHGDVEDLYGALAGRLSAEGADALGARLVTAMEGESDIDVINPAILFVPIAGRLDSDLVRRAGERLVGAMERASDNDELSYLATEFVALADVLDAGQLRRAFERLVTAMESASDSYELRNLGSEIVALAGRLDSNQVRRACVSLLTIMDGASENEGLSLINLAFLNVYFEKLAGQLDADDAFWLGERLMTALEHESDIDRLTILETRFAPLTAQLNAESAHAFGDRLVTAMLRESDIDRLEILTYLFDPLARQLDAESAQALGARLVTTMEGESYTIQLSYLANSLFALAAQLDAEGARALGERLVAAMEGEFDSDVINATILFPAIAGRLDSDLVRRAGERLVGVMESESNNDALSSLVESIAVFAGRLDSDLVRRAGERLVGLMESESNNYALRSLVESFAVFAERLDSDLVRRAGERLVAVMESESNNDALPSLVVSFAALAERLDSDLVRRAGERLVGVMESEPGVYELSSLADRFATLLGQLDAESARALGERLVATLEGESDDDRLLLLADSLAALAGKLDSGQARRVAERLVTAMIAGKANLTDYDSRANVRLLSLADHFATFAEQLDAKGAHELGARLVTAMEGESYTIQLSYLADGFAALAGQLDAEGAHALGQRLLIALMSPTLPPYFLHARVEALAKAKGESPASLGLSVKGVNYFELDRHRLAEWARGPGNDFDISSMPDAPRSIIE